MRQVVITETGLYIPVSLGYGEVDTGDEQWEEVVDEWGNPTGVERRSFKLNVQDLRTESSDNDFDEIFRVNGLSDGINNRRNVRSCEDEDSNVWQEDVFANGQLEIDVDDLREIYYEANLDVTEQEANLGYIRDIESEDEFSHSYGVEDEEVEYVLGLLTEFQLQGVVNSLLLCAMILVYSCLVTVNLIGRGLYQVGLYQVVG